MDWESLGWRGCEPPTAAVYLGTPGPRRKAVVHLVDRASGNCRAVVKVPLTDGAKIALLHEADVLMALAERTVINIHPDCYMSTGSEESQRRRLCEGQSGSQKLTPEFWRLLRTLLLPDVRPRRWLITRMTWATGNRIEWASIPQKGGAWRRRSTVLRDDSLLPACWEHGDFTPWNIKRLSDGGCTLLDWEDAQRRRLPLQDAYHFLHMQDWLFGRTAEATLLPRSGNTRSRWEFNPNGAAN